MTVVLLAGSGPREAVGSGPESPEVPRDARLFRGRPMGRAGAGPPSHHADPGEGRLWRTCGDPRGPLLAGDFGAGGFSTSGDSLPSPAFSSGTRRGRERAGAGSLGARARVLLRGSSSVQACSSGSAGSPTWEYEQSPCRAVRRPAPPEKRGAATRSRGWFGRSGAALRDSRRVRMTTEPQAQTASPPLLDDPRPSCSRTSSRWATASRGRAPSSRRCSTWPPSEARWLWLAFGADAAGADPDFAGRPHRPLALQVLAPGARTWTRWRTSSPSAWRRRRWPSRWGMRGALDVAVLLYFVACGISRLARFNVTAAELADGTGKVKYFEGTPIPTSLRAGGGAGRGSRGRGASATDAARSACGTSGP